MEAVQFRIHDGRLEYRALIIRETEQPIKGGGYQTVLSVEYKREYTDWTPVPTMNSGSQDR